ncbi:MAG: hypothetical protein HQK54_09970 [Oligoflexales bacterium]|nr:hypothetical protein [Oligoflexales bacterium]
MKISHTVFFHFVSTFIYLTYPLLAQTETGKTDDEAYNKNIVQWFLRAGAYQFSRESRVPENSGNGTVSAYSAENRIDSHLGLLYETGENRDYWLSLGVELKADADSSQKVWSNFFKEERDYEHFPLALHYMERTYRLRSEMGYNLNETFGLTAEGRYDYLHGGSNLFRKSDSLLGKQTELGRVYLFRPSLLLNISESEWIDFYTLFYKRIDKITDIYSFKTYDSKNKSFGLKFHQTFDEPFIGLSAHVFRYKLIFNDYTNDFVRTGFSTEGNMETFEGRIILGLYLALYMDNYDVPKPGVEGCQDESASGPSPGLISCKRIDNRGSVGTTFHYEIDNSSRVSLRYLYEQNKNSRMDIYNFSQHRLLLMYTYTCDGLKDKIPYHLDFGDEALTLIEGR